jgi:outer membrane protein
MKNWNLFFNILIITGIIVLFILYFNQRNTHTAKNVIPQNDKKENSAILATNLNNGEYKFAYINVDTLLAKYKLADELQEKLLKKQKQLEASLNKKTEEFQKQAAEFQEKVQTNSFLSLESAKAQEQELYEKQQKLLAYKDQISQEILQENQRLNKQLLDSVTNFLEEFNKKAGYTFIFNYATMLYALPSCDITDTVVKALNKRYETANSKK